MRGTLAFIVPVLIGRGYVLIHPKLAKQTPYYCNSFTAVLKITKVTIYLYPIHQVGWSHYYALTTYALTIECHNNSGSTLHVVIVSQHCDDPVHRLNLYTQRLVSAFHNGLLLEWWLLFLNGILQICIKFV